MSKTMTVLTRAGVVLAAALIVTGSSASVGASPNAPTHPALLATTSLNPNSLCAPDEGDNVRQSLNGDYTGCFRVPALRTTRLVVALQTLVESASRSALTPRTTLVTSAPHVHVSLTTNVTSVTPGETITLTGHVNQSISKQSLPILCWDGCGALQEEGITVRWKSSETFQLKFQIPETAWLVADDGAVTVHPLTSGRYEIGVQCLTSLSGCALQRPEAQASVVLKAPKPARCVRGRPCETMILSPTKARVGDEVFVSGWAPVQDVIGQPFSYSISVTAESKPTAYPALAYAATKSLGYFNVVLAPTAFEMGPSPPWKELGTVSYVSSTYSGASSVDPMPDSSRVAWCEPNGVVITGSGATMTVPVRGVRQALKGSILQIFSHSPNPGQCVAVQLDPHYRDSLYAAFGTAQDDTIPPVYFAPVFTTNAGASWHTVPVPKGSTLEDFGGFTTQGNVVAALFNTSNSDSATLPQGTSHGYATAEVTSNGGRSWTTSWLGCPTSGPCVQFGPYETNVCNMSDDFQALLVGPSGVGAATHVKWHYSTWVSTVDSCFAQQLVVSGPQALFLLDPSSEYPLLRSTNGGRTWRDFQLPPIPTANYGLSSPPSTNSLVMASDGSLFASVTTRLGNRQKLFRLYPRASSWCQIDDAFGGADPQRIEIGPLRVGATGLLWSQDAPSRMHIEPWANLTCH